MNRRGFFKFLGALGLTPWANKLPVSTAPKASIAVLSGGSWVDVSRVSKELIDDAMIDIHGYMARQMSTALDDFLLNGPSVTVGNFFNTNPVDMSDWDDDGLYDDDDLDDYEGLDD